MRILIIEDEKDLAKFLAALLKKNGFVADVSHDGNHGSFLARTHEYDLIITDYVLPGLDGGSIIKEIRADGQSTPILMLSARQSIADKVDILNIGADDYIAKPFSRDELLARVQALLRRPKQIEHDEIIFHDIKLDSKLFQVERRGEKIHLTNKEFALLQYLLQHAGRIVSRETLLEHVWNGDTDPFSNTVETHILRLRRKIDNKKKKLIHSVIGRGYKLDLKL